MHSVDKRHQSTRLIRVPTVCPVCGHESLHQLEIAETAAALLSGTQVMLGAQCHAGRWPASEQERAQLREYLRVLPPAGAVPTVPYPSQP